jgi:hypothetical protein
LRKAPGTYPSISQDIVMISRLSLANKIKMVMAIKTLIHSENLKKPGE